jgi:2-methylcitrate dehydratase PrpD
MGTPAQGTLLANMASRLRAAGPRATSAAIVKAKLCLIDYLACALAARELPWGRQAIAAAALDGTGSATVVGTRQRATPGNAAFANAVLGHALVRDDMHLGSVSHLGTVIFPALLASASTATTGRTFLEAALAGYEAGGKLGRLILDVEVAKIFRPTGISGPFAAAAAVARLQGLDDDAFTAALALAANSAAGYNEWAATGGSEMFFHTGFAARNAMTAVALAAGGAFASRSALDGPAGQLAAFGKAAASGTPLPFDDDAEIMAVFFKEVPACNFAQTAAQAARDIAVRNAVAANRVTSIEVRVPRAAALYPGCDCSGPFEHVLQAKMSIHYNVAAALASGNFDERNYLPSNNPTIVALAQLVRVVIDEKLTAAFPAHQGASVTVTLSDANQFASHADDVKPASNVLVRERFIAAATASLGSAQAHKLLAFVDALEAQSDASRLSALLTPADTSR